LQVRLTDSELQVSREWFADEPVRAMETSRSRYAGEPNWLAFDHAQGTDTAMKRVQKVLAEAGLNDPGELSPQAQRRLAMRACQEFCVRGIA